MKSVAVSRRVILKISTAAAASLLGSPAIIGRAQAATTKLKMSSSLPNDPKYANGRVYYDNLVKNLKANGLANRSTSRSSPTTSSARKSTSSIRSSSASST